MRVDVNPASANPGATVNVTLSLLNVVNLYGLQVDCAVDPGVLVGANRLDGDGFNSSNSFFVDNGFQPDGHWLVAASRLSPNPPISGSVAAFTLSYTVQSGGASDVICTVLGVDNNGSAIPLQVINGAFNSTVLPQQPTPTSTAALPTNTPEPTPSETPLPPTMTPAPGILSTISGTVAYQNRTDNAGITVELLAGDTLVVQLVTNADGGYQFLDVPLGSYTIAATAPEHLRLIYPVEVDADGLTIDLGSGVLRAGDTDNNQIVDLVDAASVGANVGIDAPPAPQTADLNRDGRVNISDLVLVGGNFGLSGPIAGK